MMNMNEIDFELIDYMNNGEMLFSIDDNHGVIITDREKGYREIVADENGNNIVSLDNPYEYVGALTKRERNQILRWYNDCKEGVTGTNLVPVFIYMYPFAAIVGDEYLENNYECTEYVYFPYWIVHSFYEDNEDDLRYETARELEKSIKECTFEDWFNKVYTADSVEGLFNYALENGFKPYLPSTHMC